MAGWLPAAASGLAHPLPVTLIAVERDSAIVARVAVDSALVRKLVVAPRVLRTVLKLTPEATLRRA